VLQNKASEALLHPDKAQRRRAGQWAGLKSGLALLVLGCPFAAIRIGAVCLGGEREGEKGDGEQIAHAPGPANMAARGWHSDSPAACCYELGVAEHCSLVTALGKSLFGLDRAANRQGKAAIGGYLGSVSQLTLANLALNSVDIGTTLPSR